MKNSDEIVEDVKSNRGFKNYGLLEMYLYLNVELILKMYFNNQITKEVANKHKQYAVKKYEEMKKHYEFQTSMYQEHIQNIKNTECARTKLRKLLKENTELTDVKMAEIINIAMEIISEVFKGEFE